MRGVTLETWRDAVHALSAERQFPRDAVQAVLSLLDRFEVRLKDASSAELWIAATECIRDGTWPREASELLLRAQRAIGE